MKSNNIHRSAEIECPGLGLIINYKTCVVEKSTKNATVDTTNALNKTETNKLLKNKTHSSKSLKSQTSPLLATEKSGLNSSKSNFKIEVEGRNMSANTIYENIEDYTNALAASTAGNNLNQNILDTASSKFAANKPFFSKLQQIAKTIPANKPTQFPQIEIKGHNFDNQLGDAAINTNSVLNGENTLHSINLHKKQQQNHQHVAFNDSDLFRRRNSDIEIPFKDAFNVSTMLNSKPYQLSRLSKKNSSSSGMQYNLGILFSNFIQNFLILWR